MKSLCFSALTWILFLCLHCPSHLHFNLITITVSRSKRTSNQAMSPQGVGIYQCISEFLFSAYPMGDAGFLIYLCPEIDGFIGDAFSSKRNQLATLYQTKIKEKRLSSVQGLTCLIGGSSWISYLFSYVLVWTFPNLELCTWWDHKVNTPVLWFTVFAYDIYVLSAI